ncbi:MAG: beta-mannosidase [Lachnospiraceae bacterium]
MERQELRDGWEMLWKEKTLDTSVPFSVYHDLFTHGEIEDPYYRDNAEAAMELSRDDYTYRCHFDVQPQILSCGKIQLHFDGVDTLADIYLNGSLLGSTYNMHREWEFAVKELVREKDNLLEVAFHSPIVYMEEQVRKHGSIPSNTDTLDGFNYLRKANCMSGWDWAPKLPDMGIFRPVTLLGVEEERIYGVLIRQKHEDGRVTLSFDVDTLRGRNGEPVQYQVSVTAPDGTVIQAQGSPEALVIEEPMLWWPRGYGEQNLYTVRVEALVKEQVQDVWERRIGLRTMGMKIEKDQWGESFAHEVNGVAVFAMGADYIPEDCLLPRFSRERTKELLEQCALANYNTIRVWGGAGYPEDWFFDLCDEYGFLIWEDLMFACSTYRLTEEFEENISQEIAENIRRIRHHACLGLWCGNNEMEGMIVDGYTTDPYLLGDYTRMYSYVIPKIVKREDPDAFYWPSSPSSGGDFDDPHSESRGDAHYWKVWHGYQPFPDYRKHNFRYASEFGFESLPAMKTIESFTLPEDRNVFSWVMDKHQRSENGYAKMMVYMAQYFRYPEKLCDLVYASQLLQAQAMRYGVEHWRRNRGECMGAVVWQLNDCWPVASWSSIDYFGRWKALHYFEKRFFAPVLLSCCEEGLLSQNPNLNSRPYEIEKSIRLHVANETRQEQQVKVRWSLRDSHSAVIGEEKEQSLTVPALSGVWLDREEFPQADLLEHHVYYECEMDGAVISSGSVLFSMPKFYHYQDPKLSVKQEGDELVVTAKAYAASVELLNENEDWVLSDNYFDMEAGERRVRIISGDAKKIRVRSVYNIG